MPHDRIGQKIEVGDHVMVPCVVKEVHPTDDFCNLTLETLEPMYPAGTPNTIVLNTKMVDLAQK